MSIQDILTKNTKNLYELEISKFTIYVAISNYLRAHFSNKLKKQKRKKREDVH